MIRRTLPAQRVVRNESVNVPGFVVNTHHDGAVARASASATVTVVDPASDTAPVTASVDTTDAAIWDTADKRITASASDGSTPDATATLATSSATTSTTTATTTSFTTGTSYWTGYWVWTWNATTQAWYATWVWVWVRG